MTTSPSTTRDPGLAAAVGPGDLPAGGRPLVNLRAIERGDDLHLANAIVGGAIGERVAVTRGLVRHAYGGGSVEIRQGGAGMIATAGGASLQQAGAQAVISAGSVTMRQAGSALTLARRVEVERGGLVVLNLSPRTVVHDGGRTLLGPVAALAALGGLAVAAAALTAVMRARAGATTRTRKERV